MDTVSTPFWYIATTYTTNPNGAVGAFVFSAKATAYFLKRGIHAYGPIAHSHPVAVHGDLAKFDHEFWMWADKPFMEAAVGLIVVNTLDVPQSRGIAHEIEYFRNAGKPVLFLDPDQIEEDYT